MRVSIIALIVSIHMVLTLVKRIKVMTLVMTVEISSDACCESEACYGFNYNRSDGCCVV